MAALDNIIYPSLKATVSPEDLVRVYTPTPEECALATQETAKVKDHLRPIASLGFLIYLKTFQRLGYFVPLHDVPDCITSHIAQHLQLTEHLPQLDQYQTAGTRRRHQSKIRAYRKVKPFSAGGLQVVRQAIARAAMQTEQLDDLVNVAIEELIRQSFELPGVTTRIAEAEKQRAKAYTQLYQQVLTALTPALQTLLDELFVVDPTTKRSRWDQLKDPTGQPTLGNLRGIADRLDWFSAYQPLIALVATFPEAKRRHFAEDEAMAYDIATMKDIKPPRRYTLACALLAHQYALTLDDIVDMFIKRVRGMQESAKEALQQYHAQHQDRTDTLVTALRDIVVGYQQPGDVATRFQAIDTVLTGRSDDLLQDCEAHLTYAGNNFAPFMWRFYKSYRAILLRLLTLLPLRAAGSDSRLVNAVRFLLDHATSKGQWLTVVQKERVNKVLYQETPLLDLSWVPTGWWRLVTDLPNRDLLPHRVNRRHFETCVVSQVLAALTSGDLYVVGADRFGDPFPLLLSWDDYHARIGDYCQHLGISADPTTFVAEQQRWLAEIADQTDREFPANTQVSIVNGRPSIRRTKRKPDPPGLKALEATLNPPGKPTRSILDALAYVDHWLDLTKKFGPLSGFESKLPDPVTSYLTTLFCYGTFMGPSATARTLGTLDRRQISRIDRYHIPEASLNQATELIVNHYQRCSLPRLWGSLSHASIDGTKWELYEQNLLSEQHIRYGGYGGIAIHLLSSTDIALVVNLIACSAWEGHYLLDLLDQNHSLIQPTVIHSDTQGQNAAIFGLAFLRGIELMPRIRNWQDLNLYRPAPEATYQHIDAIFAQRAIDWNLIRTHLPDLLRIALSIKEGRILPSSILRTLSAGSSKLAQACQELGRARRTGFLLRFIADADMRAMIHRETNKTESFHAFCKWLGYGSAGVIRSNERPAQSKALKYNVLLANAMMFYNTVMLSHELRDLIKSGYYVDPACVAAMGPCSTKGLERFGRYSLNVTDVPPPVDYEALVVSSKEPEGP